LGYTLENIAALIGGRLIGEGRIVIEGVNSLERATGKDIAFFVDPRYRSALEKTSAGALLVNQENEQFKGPQILVPNPVLAFARVAALFAPSPFSRQAGISREAFVHKSCRIGKDVRIYPQVYVGKESEIGDEAVLFPGVFVGDRVRIGDRSLLYPNVSVLNDCRIGKNVIIHAGTVIGSDGFGYVRDESVHVKIPQLGIVQIDDDVEIGANNTIDRAALGKTWIQRGVKTDNLVHIAHNVVIGEDTIIVAQTGVSGSVRIGRQVIIAGQVGIGDHLEIGDRAVIGPQSGVAKSVPEGKIVTGTPTMPHKLWLKTRGLITRLPELQERVRAMEKKIQDLERRLAG